MLSMIGGKSSGAGKVRRATCEGGAGCPFCKGLLEPVFSLANADPVCGLIVKADDLVSDRERASEFAGTGSGHGSGGFGLLVVINLVVRKSEPRKSDSG